MPGRIGGTRRANCGRMTGTRACESLLVACLSTSVVTPLDLLQHMPANVSCRAGSLLTENANGVSGIPVTCATGVAAAGRYHALLFSQTVGDTMSAITTLTNHQVRLAKRPVGTPTRENWSFTTEPVAEPAAGGVLVKTLALSLDPAMRGWMNDAKSYIPPVGIGEVMRAGGIGKVIASQNPKYAVGDLVSAGLGVQEYMLIPEDQIKRSGMFKIDSRLGTPTQWLNVLGMPGMTGYFGLLDIGLPKPG